MIDTLVKILMALIVIGVIISCGVPDEVKLDVQEIDINAPTCTVKQEVNCATIVCPDGSSATICGIPE